MLSPMLMYLFEGLRRVPTKINRRNGGHRHEGAAHGLVLVKAAAALAAALALPQITLVERLPPHGLLLPVVRQAVLAIRPRVGLVHQAVVERLTALVDAVPRAPARHQRIDRRNVPNSCGRRYRHLFHFQLVRIIRGGSCRQQRRTRSRGRRHRRRGGRLRRSLRRRVLRLEVHGALVQFVQQEVVYRVDVVEAVGLQRLDNHVLLEAGQLKHVLDYGLVQGLFLRGWGGNNTMSQMNRVARPRHWNIRPRVQQNLVVEQQPPVFAYLRHRQALLRVHDQHVTN